LMLNWTERCSGFPLRRNHATNPLYTAYTVWNSLGM
jgi:hypothetical protein